VIHTNLEETPRTISLRSQEKATNFQQNTQHASKFGQIKSLLHDQNLRSGRIVKNVNEIDQETENGGI